MLSWICKSKKIFEFTHRAWISDKIPLKFALVTWHWHKSHSPHFDWDLSIGNSSMVMSLVFLVDKFTIFSWIWRISFTCYKGITIVDIFSPCECSLQLLYIRRRQKEVCRTCTTSQNKSHQNYLIINLSMIVIQVWIYIYSKRRFVI